MSHVSRSVYQKLKEENKRLLNDLYIVTKEVSNEAEHVQYLEVKTRWRGKFKKDAEFNALMKVAALQYIDEHPEYHWIRDFKETKKEQ